jgi:hypothetical protein
MKSSRNHVDYSKRDNLLKQSGCDRENPKEQKISRNTGCNGEISGKRFM